MMRSIQLHALVLIVLLAGVARADYLEVRRAATIKENSRWMPRPMSDLRLALIFAS